MNILFISTTGIVDSEYGGPKGSIRNYKALCQLGEVDVYTIKKRSTLQSIFSLLEGLYPPINMKDIKCLRKIASKQYDLVYFDGSIFGKLLNLFPNSKSAVFYHNCEHDYNQVRFGHKFSIKKIVYQHLVDRNETYLTQKADWRMALSERDSRRIMELYGKGADVLIPLGIEDKYTGRISDNKERYCLMLGSFIRPNIEGYEWFINNVSPYLNCKTVIAGKGFEQFRTRWKSDYVEVTGYVEDLEEIYSKASIVAIPLLSGAGMKIKTAEAMMFGKTIFGTEEAFSGYDLTSENGHYLCKTSSEFIARINDYLAMNKDKFNPKSREVYLEKYTFHNADTAFSEMASKLGLVDSL